MARTLIIKNADFSVNKVITVDIEEDVPCTGIALNKSTSAITSIGSTDTLISTVAPVDTTDTVIWSTSNPDVVTVAEGVITSVGCGTATITATCGEYSAACSVTVTHVLEKVYELNKYYGKDSNRDYVGGGDLDNYVQLFANSKSATDTKIISYDHRSETGYYPIMIPKGAKKIVIETTDFSSRICWLMSTVPSTLFAGLAQRCPTDEAYTMGNAGDRTVVMPEKTGDYANYDSIAIAVRYYGSILSDSSMDDLVITFTA